VIQEREFERVGGSKLISVDVRIITSTNRDLKAEIAAGRFREDLFYRLNVFPIIMPALNQRSDAIVPLAEYFAKKFTLAFGKKFAGFSNGAQEVLKKYPWPGNIRELQNIIERAVILASGEIEERHLNLELPKDDTRQQDGLLSMTERAAIEKTLSEVGGNRKRAAEILGISLRTLQYRIKEYNIK
jgi:DNA-binding NtrC family response regulator